MSLHSILEKYYRETGVPAMTALVCDKDSVLDSGIIGTRRSTRESPALLSDPFHLGSITKSLTSTLAGILVERGFLTWGTKPLDIFPELEERIQPAFRDISIRMILVHEAGIQPYTSTEEFERLPRFNGSLQEERKQFAHYVLQQSPIVEPGSEVHYSNAGYSIATMMMEQIMGETWEDMLVDLIFKPLDIQAGFGWPAQGGRDEPWGHIPMDSGFQPIPPQDSFPLNLVAPAGHVHMPIEEYSKFLQLHLQGLLGNDTQILKSSSIQDLHRHSIKYGPGWGVEEMGGMVTHRHFGSGGTFFTGGAIQPERELAAAVFTNAGGEDVHNALREILVALFEAYAK